MSKSRVVALILTFILFHSAVYGQKIFGQVIDETGKGVTFATVFIKEKRQGVSTDTNGEFSIQVGPGDYEVHFQSLGYESQIQNVSVFDADLELSITLLSRTYSIDEVTVFVQPEDKAYGIMRRAIGLAPYHSVQVVGYNTDVYIKGKLTLLKYSRLVRKASQGEESAPKEGDSFVMESINEIDYRFPNHFSQKVVSKLSSFPNQMETNPLTFLPFNYYASTFNKIIMPLAPNAFTHYRFKHMGVFVDSDKIIHEIKVIPNKKSKQLVSGTLFIVDDIFCIHSLDLYCSFTLGTYRLQTQFAPLDSIVWMPISHKISAKAKLIGNEFAMDYLASVSYNDFEVNSNFVLPMQSQDTGKEEEYHQNHQQQKEQGVIDDILQKDKLTNRDMHRLSREFKRQVKSKVYDSDKSLELEGTGIVEVIVDSSEVQRDSAYWEQLRPIPLTLDERKSYQEKGLLAKDLSLDSLNPSQKPIVPKQRSLLATAFRGGQYKMAASNWQFQTKGIGLSSLVYNTVDGFAPKYSFTLQKPLQDKLFKFDHTLAYGIARNRLMFMADYAMQYSPSRRGAIHLLVGSHSKNFAHPDFINRFVNSVSTLFFRKNYAKLFQENWVEIRNVIDLANGLMLQADAKLFMRNNLVNSTDFSFLNPYKKEFTPNIPDNALYSQSGFEVPFGTRLGIKLEYTPQYFYRMEEEKKYMVNSRFPTFTFSYRVHNYHKKIFSPIHNISFGLEQTKRYEPLREIHYTVGVGGFVNGDGLHFADFKHFNTHPAPLVVGAASARLSLLPYYTYSTNHYWADGYFQYQSAFMFLKFLPLLSSIKMNEVVSIGGFTSRETPYYFEFGYGFLGFSSLISIKGSVGYLYSGDLLFGVQLGINW